MKIILYLANVIKKYRTSAVSVYSGQTAFFLILSFFPFMLFFFSLLNLTPLSENDFMMWAGSFVPEAFQELLYSFTHEIYTGSTGGRISVTIITAIYLSSRAILALCRGLNAMYEVKESRNAFWLRVYSVLYSIVLAVMLILVLGLMVFGHWLAEFFLLRIPIIGYVFQIIMQYRMLICALTLFLFFWMLYYFMPNQKQRWKQQIPGAVFSTAGWMFLSAFFSLYVDRHSNYASFYGTMTTIAFVLLWVYGCMYILFLGGLLNNARIEADSGEWEEEQ